MKNLIIIALFVIVLAIIDGERPEGNEMATLEILTALVKGGMSPVGACAMGGNIQAESEFKSNIAQIGMTKLSDEEYTAAADKGSINFTSDGIGYGLCQWTYPTRKAELINFARENLKSVGDEATQVDFCLWELKHHYTELWKYLCETQDLYGATGRICTEYEKPEVNNIDERAMYATALYMRYGGQLSCKQPIEGQEINNAPTFISKTSNNFPGQFMPLIRRGDKSPEARYLADKLNALGYDVLWSGLWACVVDFQQKMGLDVDGVCGEQTWNALMGGKK